MNPKKERPGNKYQTMKEQEGSLLKNEVPEHNVYMIFFFKVFISLFPHNEIKLVKKW